ncbi:MAG TPA: zinc ribbon domain-containing protein [Candidatus Angelobacter sp.]|nr:zinc ribbon domain-containing protein [Candidatus Angelobacter sp.]
MQCTFCGTENSPEHKFCGMCGVRLDRRQAERRTRQSGVSVKCSSCGHQGDAGLKFCGMCGTRVERRLQERRGSGTEPVRAAAIANAQMPTPEGSTARTSRPSAPVATVDLPEAGARRGEPAIFRNEPANGAHISGPSFLGLNSQPEGSSPEYLLEDEPSRGGLRTFILLVILAAIAGLIFVQWRSSFKASPKASPSKAEPAASPQPQANNQTPNDQTPRDTASPGANDYSSGSNDPASKDTHTDTKKPAENPLAAIVPSAAAAPASSPDPPEKTVPDSDAASDSSAADTRVPEETRLPDHKPSVALVRAQQYLQGRGVPQSCEQGMLYLKAATDKGDPGAAIQMAALYASGHCVKQDRVMAYRWFNSAHELEPANMWIQKNMDQLWAQMTSQERRLAGY